MSNPTNPRYRREAESVNRARQAAAVAGREAISAPEVAEYLGITTEAVRQAVAGDNVEVVFRLRASAERTVPYLLWRSVCEFWSDRIAPDDVGSTLRHDCVTLGLDGVVWNLLGERGR